METTRMQIAANAMAAALSEEIATQAMRRPTIAQLISRTPTWVFWMTFLGILVLGGFAMILPESIEPWWLDVRTDPIHHRWVDIMGE
jgi:hypothetical protein